VRRFAPAPALFFAFTLAVVASPAFAKPRDPVHEITSEIICPCSCGEVLSGCTCDTGKSMQATVENGIRAGKSKKAIVAALVSQYGEVIRGAPKAEGFNLIVWVAPFAATLLGFTIAFLILRKWVARRRVLVASATTSTRPDGTIPFPSGRALEGDLEALRARAEEELRDLRQRR
jgi:cytochrome c-type biogenesis protein CcmH